VQTLSERSSDWLQRAREATPENADTTAAVVELAEAWARGDIPLAGVRTACTGYDRFVAMNHAKAQVRDLLDALVVDQDRTEGSARTKHGRFTREDLHQAQARVTVDSRGRRVLSFPYDVEHLVPQYRPIPTHVEDEG
jgi:hypothetical protein